jgi:tRNA threonylcarbamoyladenosine biosynthesis protein TsaB
MAKILHIETATQICSVALSEGENIVLSRTSTLKNAHSSILTVFIDEIFRETGINVHNLDAVSVSMGPGSYTGLRIGVSAAKGLCYAADKPLIAVNTLEAMAWGMIKKASGFSENVADLLFCPMIDARRMEVYSAIYNFRMESIREVRAEIIDEHSFADILSNQKMLFAGDGAEKCKTSLKASSNAGFMDVFEPSANYLIEIANRKFNEGKFENVAYFEPFYLKDFIAGPPKVKGLI